MIGAQLNRRLSSRIAGGLEDYLDAAEAVLSLTNSEFDGTDGEADSVRADPELTSATKTPLLRDSFRGASDRRGGVLPTAAT